MQIVDAQVHAYERDHPGRPWIGHLHGLASATGDEMVAAMDAAGVDGALLVSPYSFYRYDASYALEVGAAHPGRCGLIKPVDPNDLAVEENIADWAKAKGAVAIRILLTYEASEDPADLGMNRILAAASRHSLPVNLLRWGRLGQAKGLIERNPNTTIVIDISGCRSLSNRRCLRNLGPSCRRSSNSPPTTMPGSRSAVPARSRMNAFPTTTFGTPSPASLMRSGSTAACGAPTGRARSHS